MGDVEFSIDRFRGLLLSEIRLPIKAPSPAWGWSILQLDLGGPNTPRPSRRTPTWPAPLACALPSPIVSCCSISCADALCGLFEQKRGWVSQQEKGRRKAHSGHVYAASRLIPPRPSQVSAPLHSSLVLVRALSTHSRKLRIDAVLLSTLACLSSLPAASTAPTTTRRRSIWGSKGEGRRGRRRTWAAAGRPATVGRLPAIFARPLCVSIPQRGNGMGGKSLRVGVVAWFDRTGSSEQRPWRRSSRPLSAGNNNTSYPSARERGANARTRGPLSPVSALAADY